jgi:diguanylate cyclase (GGDEF)-like protein
MGWFSKTSDGKASAADATALRDALLIVLEHIEGELPRSEAQRVRELLQRLQTFPVPTGVGRQTQAMIKALRATAVGSGSADFADAARALVNAMQRVSIHDKALTEEIAKLEKSVPLRVRNGDARLIEGSAKDLDKSAKAARFRKNKANEVALTLINALEASLGQALETTATLEQDVAAIRVLLADMDNPADFSQKKAALTVALRRLEDGVTLGRARVDQGVARVREVGHHLRGQSGIGGGSVRVSVDGLTQLADRNAFLDALPLALVEARNADGMLTAMRVNVDGMNRINEDYHHSSGDDVLRTVGATIVKQLRNEDFVARLGGDDFAALLPGTGTREATGAAKRLGRKVSKMLFTHQQMTFTVSVSIGLATWDGKESAESLYARTDQALARAKKSGGGQYWAAQTFQAG